MLIVIIVTRFGHNMKKLGIFQVKVHYFSFIMEVLPEFFSRGRSETNPLIVFGVHYLEH